MIATALPGGDTLGSSGVINESVCQRSVDMTISGAGRSIVSGTGTCQLRTLPPTKGFVLAESTPAGGMVNDSSSLVNAGGELYEASVGGVRDAAVLLTPNRSLSTSRAISFAPGNNGNVGFSLAAAVQPSTGLQSSWLTGTYTITSRLHAFNQTASGLESSVYANPNFALGEHNYTTAMTVTFNGNGTCNILEQDSRVSFSLTKDPLFNALGEMDVTCTAGGGNCGQNEGDDYVAMGNVNIGSTTVGNDSNVNAEADWLDASGDPDNNGARQVACTYTVPSAGKMTVNYSTENGDMANPLGTNTNNTWSVTYDVSSDLRYLVSDGNSLVDHIQAGSDGLQKGGISVGVRNTATALQTGKTYLFNSVESNTAASTPTTASYENPATPVYQEEECVSRGSLTLSAAGACTYNVVNTCSGRNKWGKEELTDGGADATIVDNMTVFDGAPAVSPTCAWTGNARDLTVSVDILDQEGNQVTMAYTGSQSDNGEALVLQGTYSVTGLVPDVENPPLLPQQKFNMSSYMIAQQYLGTLTADADADGLTNISEFQWAKNNGPVGSVSNDYNNDGTSDILMTKPSTAENFIFPFTNGESGAYAKGGLYPNVAWTVQTTEDFDADGDTDVIERGPTEWHIFNMEGGVSIGSAKISLYGGTWGFDSTADLNGDGTPDIILKDSATSAYRGFLVANRAVTGSNTLGLFSAPWAVVATADFDGDGDDDILQRNATTKAWRVFTVQNGVVTGNGNMAMYGGTWEFVSAADFDGDNDADVVLRDSATGAWKTFISQNNAVIANANSGLFPDTAWDFAFASDLNADGTMDIVIKNVTKGEWWRGVFAGGVVNSSNKFSLYASSAWEVASSQNDYNGDGTDDVILFKPSSFEYFTSGIFGGTVQYSKKSKIFPVDQALWAIKD